MNPAILKDIALFVLDMDGTIYLGERPFPAAIEFIRRAKASGRRIVYFTNNASKNPAVYYEKLLRLGFSAEREEIVTAGDVTAEYLQTYHKGAKVYLVGTPFLEASFREKGIFLTDGREADIVVSSFDTTLTYEKLEKPARSSAAARGSIPRTPISTARPKPASSPTAAPSAR